MADRTIVCANCGARYKIPETFRGAKARCKACGAVIEIDEAAAPAAPAEAPAAPEPAAKARPERSSTRRSGAASRSTSTVGRSRGASSRRRKEEAGGGDGGRPSRRHAGSRRGGSAKHGSSKAARRKRGGEEEGEPKSKTPLILGISAGSIALLVTILVLATSGNDEEPKPIDAGPAVADAGPEETTPPAEQPAEQPDNPEEAGATEAGAKPAEGKPAEAVAKKPPVKPTPEHAPEKLPPGQSATPFDPMELEELPFPDDIDGQTQEQAMMLVQTAFEDQAFRGMKAARELQELGRAAFPAVINKLREVDYLDPVQSEAAYGLHKVLEKITLGLNLGYNQPSGRPPTQQEAWWNARTAKGWHGFWKGQAQNGDAGAWQDLMEKRRQKVEEGSGR